MSVRARPAQTSVRARELRSPAKGGSRHQIRRAFALLAKQRSQEREVHSSARPSLGRARNGLSRLDESQCPFSEASGTSLSASTDSVGQRAAAPMAVDPSGASSQHQHEGASSDPLIRTKRRWLSGGPDTRVQRQPTPRARLLSRLQGRQHIPVDDGRYRVEQGYEL